MNAWLKRCVFNIDLNRESVSTYGGREVQNNITKCETLLRSSRQIYILENIFTYHKTELHGKNTFTKDETNLHFGKHFYLS